MGTGKQWCIREIKIIPDDKQLKEQVSFKEGFQQQIPYASKPDQSDDCTSYRLLHEALSKVVLYFPINYIIIISILLWYLGHKCRYFISKLQL